MILYILQGKYRCANVRKGGKGKMHSKNLTASYAKNYLYYIVNYRPKQKAQDEG